MQQPILVPNMHFGNIHSQYDIFSMLTVSVVRLSVMPQFLKMQYLRCWRTVFFECQWWSMHQMLLLYLHRRRSNRKQSSASNFVFGRRMRNSDSHIKVGVGCRHMQLRYYVLCSDQCQNSRTVTVRSAAVGLLQFGRQWVC